jgi:hypothetical protein
MKKKASALRSAEAEELSRLLTVERLKQAKVENLAASDDPDLKPLADAVRKVSTKKAKKTPFTPDDIKKLAGF